MTEDDDNTERWNLKIRLARLGLDVDQHVLRIAKRHNNAEITARETGLWQSTIIAVLNDAFRIRNGRYQ